MSRIVPLAICLSLAACKTVGPASRPASLTALVPSEAVGVALLRDSGLSVLREQIERDVALHHELREYLAQRIGLDLTAITSAALFVTSVVPPQGAIVLAMGGRGRPRPKWPQVGEATDWAPAQSCCPSKDHACRPDPSNFAAPTWKALAFDITDTFRYQYRYTSSAKDFVVEARGDLDCDGKFSSFRRRGVVSPNGDVTGARGLEQADELE